MNFAVFYLGVYGLSLYIQFLEFVNGAGCRFEVHELWSFWALRQLTARWNAIRYKVAPLLWMGATGDPCPGITPLRRPATARSEGRSTAAPGGWQPHSRASHSSPSQVRSSPHASALFRPCLRPSERVPARSVPSKPHPAALEAVLMGRNGPGRARTVANRTRTALTGATRTGPQAQSSQGKGQHMSRRIWPVRRCDTDLFVSSDAVPPSWRNVRAFISGETERLLRRLWNVSSNASRGTGRLPLFLRYWAIFCCDCSWCLSVAGCGWEPAAVAVTQPDSRTTHIARAAAAVGKNYSPAAADPRWTGHLSRRPLAAGQLPRERPLGGQRA